VGRASGNEAGTGGGSPAGAGGGNASGTGGNEAGTDGDEAGAGGGQNAFSLSSTAFADMGSIGGQYQCGATGVSPPVSWTAGPLGTASYAVVMVACWLLCRIAASLQGSSVTRHVDSHDGCRRAREKRSRRQRALVAEDRWVSFGPSLDGDGHD
jgi:hypothetical protein